MDRRPLKSRNSWWSKLFLNGLLKTSITPDQISITSLIFAGLSGLFFSLQASSPFLFIIFGTVCMQLRLLCNLLDGMLAVEGGRGSKYGALYNELPDRAADAIIILGVGLGYSEVSVLGITTLNWAWCAALLAVSSAYVRAFGASLNGKHEFVGPMAKPQRMALLTAAAIFQVLISQPYIPILPWSLLVMNAGLIYTIARRLNKIARTISTRL